MRLTPRALLAGGIFLGFVAGLFLGYSVRWLEDSSPRPAPAPLVRAAGGPPAGPPGPAAAPDRGLQPGAVEERADRPGGVGHAARPGLGALERLSETDLIEELRRAAESHDSQRFWLAAAALGPLNPGQLGQVAAILEERRHDLLAAELLFGELVHYGGADGLQAIARLVQDPGADAGFRNKAVEALGGIPAARREEAVPIVRDLLESGLRFDELAGAQVLGWLLGPRAIPGLIEVLDWWLSPDRSTPIEKGSWDELSIMNNILKAVQDFAGGDDLELLAGLFGRRMDRGLQALLCHIMSHAAGERATETMLELLIHPPEGAPRDLFAETLAKTAGKDDVPRIRAALEAESEPRVQMLLATILARLAGVEEMRVLVGRAMEPGSRLSPDSLIEPLLRAKSKDMVPLMLDLARVVQGQYAVCRLAKGVLGLLGTEEGARQLLSLAADGGDYRTLREVGRAILEEDPEHDPLPILAMLERSTDSVQRSALADILKHERETYASSSRNGEVVPALLRLLANEKDPGVQERLAAAIAGSGDEGRSSLVELMAGDADAGRRLEILRSLELLPPQDTVSLALRVLRQDPSPEVRSKAARIAGAGSDPALLKELSAILSAEADPQVRASIEEVLHRRQGRR